MAIKHSISLRIIDSDGNTVRSTTYWEEDIEQIGGVGAIVESIEALLGNNETVEITTCYHE